MTGMDEHHHPEDSCRAHITEAARQAAELAASQTRAEMASEIQAAVDKGVSDALERAGIDTHDHRQSQADMQFLREWRESAGQVRKKALGAAIVVIVTAALGALWLGLKTAMPH